MDATVDDFFTKRHKRLLDLAKIARIASWIILGIYILWAFFRISIGMNAFKNSHLYTMGDDTLWDLLSLDPLAILNIWTDGLTRFFTGGIFLVILQGISLGLCMIVETNLNIQGISRGG